MTKEIALAFLASLGRINQRFATDHGIDRVDTTLLLLLAAMTFARAAGCDRATWLQQAEQTWDGHTNRWLQ